MAFRGPVLLVGQALGIHDASAFAIVQTIKEFGKKVLRNEQNQLDTGANSGLGKTAALALAKMRTNVAMLCRDKTRGETALADINA
jgi:short-subunit dehydrogenase